MADRYVVVEIDLNDGTEAELEEFDNWGDAHEKAEAYKAHVKAMANYYRSNDPDKLYLVDGKDYEVREV